MKPQRLLLSFLIILTFAYQVLSQGYSYPVPNKPLQYPGENDVLPTQDSYRRGRSRVTYGTPEDNVNSDLILDKDRPGGTRETVRERTSTRTETSSRGGGGGGGRVIEEEVIIRRDPSPTPAERVVERVVEEQVVSRGSQRGSTSSSYSTVPVRRRIVYVDPPAATVVRRRIIIRRRNGGGSSSSSDYVAGNGGSTTGGSSTIRRTIHSSYGGSSGSNLGSTGSNSDRSSSSSDYVAGSGGSTTGGSSTIRRTIHSSYGGSSGSNLGSTGSSSDHSSSSSTSSSSGHNHIVGGDGQGQTIRRRVYYTTVPSGISGSRVITRYVDRSRNSVSDSELVDKPLYTTGSYRTRYRYVTRAGCGDATSSLSSCGGGGSSSSRSSSSSNTGGTIGGTTRTTTRTIVNNRQGSVGEYVDDKQDEIDDYDDEPEPQERQRPMNYNNGRSNPNSAGSGYIPPVSGAGGYNVMPPQQQYVVRTTPPTYVPSPPAYQYYPQQYVPAPSPTTYVAPSQPSYIPQPTYIPQAVVTVPSQTAYVPQQIAPTYAPVVQQYPSQQGYPGGVGYPPQQQNYGGVGGGYGIPGGEGFGQNGGGYGGNGGYAPNGAGGYGQGGGGAGNGFGGGNAGGNGYGGGNAAGNGYGGGNQGGGGGYGGPNGGGGGFGAGSRGGSGNGFQNGNRGRGNGGGGRRGGGGGGRGYGSGTGRSSGGTIGARRGRSFRTSDNQDLRTSGSINHPTYAFPGSTAGGGGTQREVVEEVIYDERERDAGVTREEVLNSGGNVENIQDVRDRVNNEIVREEVIEERQRFVEGGEGDNGGGAIEERFVENGDGGFTESGSSSTFSRRRTALRDDRKKNERTRVGAGGGSSSSRYSSTNIREQVSNNRPTERVVQRTITRESSGTSAATNRELANKAYGIGAGNDESISGSSTRRKLLETSFRKDVKAPSYGGVPDEENFNVRSNTANDVNNSFRSSSSRTASSVSSQASGSSRSYSSIPDDEGESGNVIIRKTTTRILESSAPAASIEGDRAIQSAQVIEGGTFAASNKDQVINRGGRTSITSRTINRSSSSSSGGGRASYGSLDDDSDGSGSTQNFRVFRHSGGDSHSAASNTNNQYRQLPSHYKQLMTGTPDEVAAMTGATYMYTRAAPICPSGGCSPVASLRGGSEFRAPRTPTSPSLFPAFRAQLNLEHL